MRIQHNIPAMNAYRNSTINAKNVAKNLEKLSSGYRINRAGDDAAGLAISEKMRAQITGLNASMKNAQDGISMLQTAEGSLTEVHSMLNRMFELSTQAANGTYDNAVDRANLQKEVNALNSEIDRIADSSNYNGIKLLDGSLGSKTTTGSPAAITVSGAGALTDNVAIAGKVSSNITIGTQETDHVIDTTSSPNGSVIQLKLSADTGKTYMLNFQFGAGDITAAHFRSAIKSELESGGSTDFKAKNPDWAEISSLFNFGVAAQGAGAGESKIGELDLTFTAKNAGTGKPQIAGLTMEAHKLDASGVMDSLASSTSTVFGTAFAASGTAAGDTFIATAPGDAFKSINFADTNSALNGKTVTIGDKTYQFVKATELDKVAYGNLATVLGADKASTMDNLVSRLKANGVTTASTYNTGSDTVVRIGNPDELKNSGKPTTVSGGLTLQVGDSAQSYNKITVSIGDMHAKALGTSSINISTQEGAAAAMDKIKSAINSVSSTRGDLGALENRLDHTINNLAVTHENIMDAESHIRDTDMAKEMMAYTKNNFLVQSAQAMLAQANQTPQSILRLLG